MEHAGQITVNLSSEILQVIGLSVAAGEYGSTAEAVRDSVLLWQHNRPEDDERSSEIRARVRCCLDDPRPDMTIEEVDARFDEVERF